MSTTTAYRTARPHKTRIEFTATDESRHAVVWDTEHNGPDRYRVSFWDRDADRPTEQHQFPAKEAATTAAKFWVCWIA